MGDFLLIIIDLFIGVLIASSVSYFAYYKRSLSLSGMIAAIVIGTIIFVTGGWLFTAMMLTFFGSSSLLSKIGKNGKKEDSLRTYKQVLANGLIATIISIVYASTNQNPIFELLFAISIAVSTADTWASEIGRLSKQYPRYILTWKTVEHGRSGGVTLLGLLASLLGSTVIALFAQFHLYVIVFGLLGSIIDSVLGTIQIGYKTADGRILDNPPEEGFVATKGLSFLSNNLVNLLSNILVVVIGYFVLMAI